MGLDPSPPPLALYIRKRALHIFKEKLHLHKRAHHTFTKESYTSTKSPTNLVPAASKTARKHEPYPCAKEPDMYTKESSICTKECGERALQIRSLAHPIRQASTSKNTSEIPNAKQPQHTTLPQKSTENMRKRALHMLFTERWGAGVETQKNVRREIGGWGRVPFNEPYAPLLSTIYDGA